MFIKKASQVLQLSIISFIPLCILYLEWSWAITFPPVVLIGWYSVQLFDKFVFHETLSNAIPTYYSTTNFKLHLTIAPSSLYHWVRDGLASIVFTSMMWSYLGTGTRTFILYISRGSWKGSLMDILLFSFTRQACLELYRSLKVPPV